MTTTTAERKNLTPLALKAAEEGLTREQMLRRAMRDRTAVQKEGRWFVAIERDRSTMGRDS